MDEHTSHELAYKKGYDKGYEDGKRDAVKHGRWVDVALRFNQVKEKCSICGGMAMPTGSTSAQTAVQRWTKRSNNMAQSKTKEEKVAEVPRVCVCVCGREPCMVKHKSKYMLSCPVPTECAMRSRWAKTEQAAIKAWNVEIESAKHERR